MPLDCAQRTDRMLPSYEAWVGWDPREAAGFAVTVRSMIETARKPLPVYPLMQTCLRAQGWYRRPQSRRDGRLWDDISGAPMATEFALTRFLLPWLSRSRFALFCDADFLFKADVWRLVDLAVRDRCGKAVWLVPHDHAPAETVKMDNQVQTAYPRKNWSSLMLFNCDHPAWKRVPVAIVNEWLGLDLHGLRMLEDAEIGHLPADWNWLINVQPRPAQVAAGHFTLGTPDMVGRDDQPLADEWDAALARVGLPE